jgi:hypothetical protein
VAHLRSDNYVCYSYAAITIERILFIKQNNRLLYVGIILCYISSIIILRFTQADIHGFANEILVALFDKIEAGNSPEKVSENDYLMKCTLFFFIQHCILLISHRCYENHPYSTAVLGACLPAGFGSSCEHFVNYL